MRQELILTEIVGYIISRETWRVQLANPKPFSLSLDFQEQSCSPAGLQFPSTYLGMACLDLRPT